MPVSQVNSFEVESSGRTGFNGQAQTGFVDAAAGIRAALSPDLLFALGVRTHNLADLIQPLRQLHHAQTVDDLPNSTELGYVLPADDCRGDYTLPIDPAR